MVPAAPCAVVVGCGILSEWQQPTVSCQSDWQQPIVSCQQVSLKDLPAHRSALWGWHQGSVAAAAEPGSECDAAAGACPWTSYA